MEIVEWINGGSGKVECAVLGFLQRSWASFLFYLLFLPLLPPLLCYLKFLLPSYTLSKK